VSEVPALDKPAALTAAQRWLVLVAAFLAWAFAGQGIALYVLIHRQLVLGLAGDVDEVAVTRWFAWFQAAFLFGAAAGGWLFGWLGDRVGRVRALGAAVLCYSLFTLAAYFAGRLEEQLTLRLLASVGIGGAWPGAVALVSEAWPDASRPLLAGLLGAAASFGFVWLAALAYFVLPVTAQTWSWMLLVGSAPAVLGVAILLFVPESPRWRAAVGRTAAPSAPLAEVFRPPLLSVTLLGIGLGAIPIVGTAANANWTIPWTDQVAQQRAAETGQKKPKDDKALTMMTRNSGAIVGSFFGGLIASVVGRRLTYFLISLGAFALSCVVFGMLDPGHAWFQVFVFFLGLVGVTYFGWLPLFLPELFPTRVRATGAGVSFNTGRIVAGVVVLSAGAMVALLGGSYARIGLWSGTIYVAGMALIWLAPLQRQEGGAMREE
jgi:MFS family permease